jgi:ribosome-associated heat shock protein Hsp15
VAEPRAEIRVDKWLWHARLCKTRSQAARLVAAGAVRINTVRVTKPAAALHVGDGVTCIVNGRVRALRVLGLGTRRGPAPEAQGLYHDLDQGTSPAGLEPTPQPDK